MVTRVKFNVRGSIFETSAATLNKYPTSLLGTAEKRVVYTNPSTQCIDVDCNDLVFNAILFFYQSEGMLSRPPSISVEEFLLACELFELEEFAIQNFCDRESYVRPLKEEPKVEVIVEDTTCKSKVWLFLEDPGSSSLANIYAGVSTFFIVVSTVVSFLVTLPEVRSSRTFDLNNDVWSQMELILNLIFGTEYALRISFSPNKVQFLFEFQNIVDLVAVLPYFILLSASPSESGSIGFLRAVRTVRVLRILRLSKQSSTISSVVTCVKTCLEEFSVMLSCLFVVCCLCGSVQYYLEHDNADTQFTSIPEAMWWAVQTIVTLGYGDIIPITTYGKMFAMAVAVFGVLTLSIPLLALGSKYVGMSMQTIRPKTMSEDDRPAITRYIPEELDTISLVTTLER